MTYPRWLHSNFIPYCQRIGVDLHRDDIRFIERVLPRIPMDRQRTLLRDYVATWQQQPNQNQGRFAANTFLRESLDD